MKRKATRFLALAMSAVLVTSLTACGDGSDENAKDAVTPVEAQPMLSELELEILNLETKYNKGEFTQEDYLTLADAYNRAGYIRKQRDMLEQDYRLYADEEAFAALQEISVNLEEETEGIRSRAQEMQNDLELTEYLGESVNLIDSEDWFITMMPKLKEGQRNYYLERDSQPLLYVQTGYTEEGQCFSRVWYTGNDTKRFLSQEGATIRLVTVTAAGADENIADPAETENSDATQETGTTEARARENTTTEISDTTAPLTDTPETMKDWNGTFEAWSVDSATGSITHEQGTMQGGVLTGDYTCDVHTGEGALDVYSLWSNREGMEYITYTGSFDSEGKILTEQPSEEIKKKLLEGTDYTDLILYAYDATGENCLWQGIGGGITAEEYRFGGEMIGLETRPEYTSYEVTEDMTAENNANTADGTGAAADGGENGNAAENTTGAIDSDTPQIRILTEKYNGLTENTGSAPVRSEKWQNRILLRLMKKTMIPLHPEASREALPAKSPAVQMATVQPVTMGRRSPAAEPCRETRPVEVFRNLQPPRIPVPRQSPRPNLLRQSLQSLRPLRPHRLRPRNLYRIMTMTTMMMTAATVIPAATIAEAVTAAVPVETAAEVM